jgi:preprotein translocase subunit YajC
MERIAGLVLLVVGVVLLIFGINASQKVPDQTVEKVSGKFTDNTMVYLVGGIACVVAGGAITWKYWE